MGRAEEVGVPPIRISLDRFAHEGARGRAGLGPLDTVSGGLTPEQLAERIRPLMIRATPR